MNVIVPIKNKAYVDVFADAGADEFYGSCIYVPWEKRFGSNIEYNRRGNYGDRANCPDERALLETVSLSARRGIPFYLTANALRITDAQADCLRPLLRHFREAGGYGVIISDISMIQAVKEQSLEVIISSCAEVINGASASFYRDLGCERIILPRNITLDEIAAIKKQVPELQYEVFFLNSGCRFTDGNCLGSHKKAMGELCQYCDRHSEGAEPLVPQPLSAEKRKQISNNEVAYASLLQKACAFCSLYELCNVADSIKIVERAASEEKILWQLQMTKQLLRTAEDCRSGLEYRMRMTFPKDAQRRCRGFLNCYYRTDLAAAREQEASAIAHQYVECKEHIDVPLRAEYIDYIGINTANLAEKPFNFKVYYTPKASSRVSHRLIDYLSEKGMIRHLTCIGEDSAVQKLRFDIGLKKRTNGNIRALLDVLEADASYFRSFREQAEKLAGMEIHASADLALSSLYFVGMIEKGGVIQNLKFHYLNRRCENPDQIGKHVTYQDDVYLDFLKQTGIPEFLSVTEPVAYVLSQKDGNLWMTGADYEKSGRVKYKQYVKCSDVLLLDTLIDFCQTHPDWNASVWQLIGIRDWFRKQDALIIDGFAACIDTEGTRSFNFYFRLAK